MHLIHNERAKLRAAFFNNLAVGFMLGGLFFLPVIQALAPKSVPVPLWLAVAVFLAGSCVFIWIADRQLGELRED